VNIQTESPHSPDEHLFAAPEAASSRVEHIRKKLDIPHVASSLVGNFSNVEQSKEKEKEKEAPVDNEAFADNLFRNTAFRRAQPTTLPLSQERLKKLPFSFEISIRELPGMDKAATERVERFLGGPSKLILSLCRENDCYPYGSIGAATVVSDKDYLMGCLLPPDPIYFFFRKHVGEVFTPQLLEEFTRMEGAFLHDKVFPSNEFEDTEE
jgi:hypothetical protein